MNTSTLAWLYTWDAVRGETKEWDARTLGRQSGVQPGLVKIIEMNKLVKILVFLTMIEKHGINI